MANLDNLLDVLTIPDAAELIGIHAGSVRAAIAQGRMPAAKMLGRTVIRRRDAEDYKARTQPDGKPRAGRPRKEGK